MVADEILEALREAGEEGMSRTEIHDLFGRHLKGRVLGAILRDLEAQGRIHRKKMPKGEGPGRPPEVWCIRDE
jgi:predicted transcriptional regulator